MPKNKKLALNTGIQTKQILTNDDRVCIPRCSSILLAVLNLRIFKEHCMIETALELLRSKKH